MLAVQELRGFGTLSIGTAHFARIEYRIFVRKVDRREQAIGVIAGSDDALWEAFNTGGVLLTLEDGRVARIATGLLAEGRTDMRTIGWPQDPE